MKERLLLPMPGNEAITRALSASLGWAIGEVETRHFPDGESYIRIPTVVDARPVIVVCTLAHPDEKFLPLIFAAATAHELGAPSIGLVAPYLAYMRQDRRFKDGEAVTSQHFAKLLSGAFDWLITVDPHLHRYTSLNEIYSIPTRVLHAAPLISQWIKENAPNAVIIGPDSESEQWVADVARNASVPYSVLEKKRRGDRDVVITLKDMGAWRDRTPILVDDIVSSGRTMIEAVRLLIADGWPPPICLAVHGIFADRSDELLAASGARVVTANTIPHGTNRIDVSQLLAPALLQVGLRPERPN